MKTRILVSLMLALACTSLVGLTEASASGAKATKKQKVKQELWPDGTPMSAWFSDTSRVDLSNLKHFVVTDYGVDGYSEQVQTERLQAVIDRSANEGG